MWDRLVIFWATSDGEAGVASISSKHTEKSMSKDLKKL